MSDEIEVFLNKVETFAEGLSMTEQAMLAYLVGDDADDEVAGFNFFEAWPQKWSEDLAPLKVDNLRTNFGGFLSSGHVGSVISGETGKGEI